MRLGIGLGLNLMQGATGASSTAPPDPVGNSPATAAIVSGSPLVGSVLIGQVNDPDGIAEEFTYQYEESANGEDGWGAIAHPSSSSPNYTVLAGDTGKYIRFVVELQDSLGNFEAAISAPIGPVINPALPAQIIFEGDSLTAGSGLTTPETYPAQFDALLNASEYECSNVATGGNTLLQMIDQYAAQVAPLFSLATYSSNVVILLGGTNDFAIGGATATDVINRITSYGTTAKGAGFKVLVCTIPPFSTGTTETSRQTVNTALRGDISAFADGLIDFAADARLSNRADTTYFQGDGVHFTPAGSAVQAELAAIAVLDLLNRNDSGTILVSGTPTEGQTLTASVSDLNGLVGVTIAYQWQRSANGTTGWSNTASATASTYLLVTADVNQYVRCTATYTDQGGFAESIQSASTAQIAAVPATLEGYIATVLPQAPSGRRTAIANAATFANSGNPQAVIDIIASGSVVVSGLLEDGCLFTSTANKSDPADVAADSVGSIWGWNNNSAPLFTQTTSGSQPATTASDGLRIAAGRFATGQPTNGWTTSGEIVRVLRVDLDPPANNGAIEGYGTTSANAQAGSGSKSVLYPFSSGSVIDAWASSSAATTGRISKNWTAPLTNFNLYRSTCNSLTSRATQLNLEAEGTDTDAIATAFDAWYSLGNSSSAQSNSANYKFVWMRQTPLSSGDRNLLYRFLSSYCGLGLY